MSVRPARFVTALAAGLLITVLIAWAAMFWPYGKHGYGPATSVEVGLAKTADGHRIWQISEGRNAWHRVLAFHHMQISGASIMIPVDDYEARKVDLESLPRHLRPVSLDELKMLSWYREVGWPMRALACSIHWKTQVRNADIIYTVRGGVQLPRDRKFNPRAIPLAPVWPGLAVNTALYGGAWMLLVGALRAVRRVRRRRAGRCVRCGYPRAGLPPGSLCPECGQ